MKRLVVAVLAALCPTLANAQLAPPVPCVTVLADGRTTAQGFSFASVMDGRLAMLLLRSREGTSDATDFTPIPNRPGASFFHENLEVRIGDRPQSIFLLAVVREDGTILVERWSRTNPRESELTSYVLRCGR